MEESLTNSNVAPIATVEDNAGTRTRQTERSLLLKEWQFWTLTAGGTLFVALILVNIFFFTQNRALQVAINNRQQYINQSVQLEVLNKEIISALANLTVRDKDDELKQLLGNHGITVSTTANPPSETAERPQAKGRK